jgi:hypothetical protein
MSTNKKLNANIQYSIKTFVVSFGIRGINSKYSYLYPNLSTFSKGLLLNSNRSYATKRAAKRRAREAQLNRYRDYKAQKKWYGRKPLTKDSDYYTGEKEHGNFYKDRLEVREQLKFNKENYPNFLKHVKFHPRMKEKHLNLYHGREHTELTLSNFHYFLDSPFSDGQKLN